MQIKWVPFPLHPEIPLPGMSILDLFKGREDMIAGFRERMKGLMDAEGLPYGDRTMTYNSRLAQELALWADTQPGGDAIHDLLYKAYFVDNVNLAELDVLVPLAEAAGLDGQEARRILLERVMSEKVDADWQRAHYYGITGVPTFVSNKLMLVGCQEYDVLEQFVAHLRNQDQAP